MRNKKYDIFKGGAEEFLKDLKQYEKDFRTLSPLINDELGKVFLETVKTEAQSISYNPQMQDSVMNYNQVNKLGRRTVVSNFTQHATYSEFGTGVVGQSSPAHPDPRMNWEHDVNEHGEKGWVYPIEGGRYIHTKGVPSNPVYYRSAKITREKLLSISKEIIRKVIK